jgi:peroxidase
MAMSEGDNLPIVMTEQGPAFAAGDVRAQENPDLTALQVLFVREHNYQVDRLHEEHQNWSGDRLYETARAITTAEMVNITYNEFLPHLLGPDAIPDYSGYDPNVDPTITAEFAGAAFRFGHSLVSSDIDAMNDLGANTSAQGLAETFFESPETFVATAAPTAYCATLPATPRMSWTNTSSTTCAIFSTIRRSPLTLPQSTSGALTTSAWEP